MFLANNCMNRHLTSAIWAAGITVISVVGTFAAVATPHPSPWRWILVSAAVLSFPAAFIVGFLGLGHGPEGFPNQEDVVLYLFTFLFWWGIVELALWMRDAANTPSHRNPDK